MRRPIVAGNWKLHGSRAENARLTEALTAQLPSKSPAQCIVCPPFVYLQEISRALHQSSIDLGAQDVCAEPQGAFTGEVSAAMLKDVGCEYVIVGHSERRLIYRESDQLVARKFAAAQSKSLIPILCVGEQLAEREAGDQTEVVRRQIAGALAGHDPAALRTAGIVIAYEPVWAIGTGRNASGQDASAMADAIRTAVGESWPAVVEDLPVLYGGSVTSANIGEFLTEPAIDGALVGGASLKPDEMAGIVARAGLTAAARGAAA
jgi:triosephosphate isomerase (TIM)